MNVVQAWTSSKSVSGQAASGELSWHAGRQLRARMGWTASKVVASLGQIVEASTPVHDPYSDCPGGALLLLPQAARASKGTK